jgi:hypothetical protein
MSDASMSHCAKCARPEYACECENPDFQPSLVEQIWTGKYVDMRGRSGCCPKCGGWLPGAERLFFMVRRCVCAERIQEPECLSAT